MFDFDGLDDTSSGDAEASTLSICADNAQGFVTALEQLKCERAQAELLGRLDQCLAAGITQRPEASPAWVSFFLDAVEAAAPKNAPLPAQVRSPPANPANVAWIRKAQAVPPGLDTKLFMRLYAMSLSPDVDVIETTRAQTEPKAIVLILGKGGGSLLDLQPFVTYYTKDAGCHVIATTMCGIKALRLNQVVAVVDKLAELLYIHAGLPVVVHLFSNTGYYMWGQILQRWRGARNLPTPDDSIFGIVYDSASDAAIAEPLPDDVQPPPPYPPDMYIQFVVLNCVAGLVYATAPKELARVQMRAKAEIPVVAFRCADAIGLDDPCFGRGPSEWLELGKQEPPGVQRLLLYGSHDKVVQPAASERFKQWLDVFYSSTVKVCKFEKTVHAKHHELEDGTPYFNKLRGFLEPL